MVEVNGLLPLEPERGAQWRKIAEAKKLGVPQALGLSLEDWVTSRLGGYVKLSIPDRREAVKELATEGLSTRDIGDVLGVDHSTVVRDGANAPDRLQNCSDHRGPDDDDGANAPAPAPPPDKFGRTAKEAEDEAKLTTAVARAHAAVVAVLPVLGAGARLEFYSRALNLAAAVRRISDGEAVRLAEELCRELAGMRPIPPRA
jgi:hypothetical protein